MLKIIWKVAYFESYCLKSWLFWKLLFEKLFILKVIIWKLFILKVIRKVVYFEHYLKNCLFWK